MDENACGGTSAHESQFNTCRFSVVILYDGAAAGRRAINQLRKVAGQWTEDLDFQISSWRLNDLMDGAADTAAAQDLGKADLLMLALDDDASLNEATRNRLQQAIHQMGGPGTAIAILTNDEKPIARSCFDFLHRAAKESGVDWVFPSASNAADENETGDPLAPRQKSAPALVDPHGNSASAGGETWHLIGTEPQPRILCVDDDASIRQLCKCSLTKLGYDVATAADGAEAWAALNDEQYHLLVTDNEMPHVSGPELIRKMRLAGMAMPVILMSGALAAVPLNSLSRLECDAFLAKPFTLERFLSIVHEVLRSAPSLKTLPEK